MVSPEGKPRLSRMSSFLPTGGTAPNPACDGLDASCFPEKPHTPCSEAGMATAPFLGHLSYPHTSQVPLKSTVICSQC